MEQQDKIRWIFLGCMIVTIALTATGAFIIGGHVACESGSMQGFHCVDVKELGVCVHSDGKKYIVPENWSNTMNNFPGVKP